MKASDNAYPSVLLVDGSPPANPAAGRLRLFVQGGVLKLVDSAGTVVATGEVTQAELDALAAVVATKTSYTDENARDAIGSALVAGTNMTVTVNDAGDQITLASTGGYTDENARDALGAALVAGTGIAITPNDAGDTITIATSGSAAGNVNHRGVWNIVTTYAALDQVTAGGSLWMATTGSTGTVPSTTRSYANAGSDAASALVQNGHPQFIHKFKLSADTLIGAVQFATVSPGVLTDFVSFYLTTQIVTSGATTDPTQLTPVKTVIPSDGGATANIFWNRLYLDDPITLVAGVEYALVVKSASSFNTNQLAQNPTAAYTGVVVAPTTTAEDLYRSVDGGSWSPESAGRRQVVSLLSTAAVAWERIATETPAATDISDSSSIGRAVVTAVSQAAARTATGAGTSSLAIGQTATDAPSAIQTIVAKTASYTLALSDINKLLTFSATSGMTLQIPTDASVAFPIGARVDVAVVNTGMVTVAAVTPGTTTVTGTPSLVSRATPSVFSVQKVAANVWIAYGDLA